MPVIRCERCGASQYVAVALTIHPDCSRCGHHMALTRKTLVDPVIAAGLAQRVRLPGAWRRWRA